MCYCNRGKGLMWTELHFIQKWLGLLKEEGENGQQSEQGLNRVREVKNSKWERRKPNGFSRLLLSHKDWEKRVLSLVIGWKKYQILTAGLSFLRQAFTRRQGSSWGHGLELLEIMLMFCSGLYRTRMKPSQEARTLAKVWSRKKKNIFSGFIIYLWQDLVKDRVQLLLWR